MPVGTATSSIAFPTVKSSRILTPCSGPNRRTARRGFEVDRRMWAIATGPVSSATLSRAGAMTGKSSARWSTFPTVCRISTPSWSPIVTPCSRRLRLLRLKTTVYTPLTSTSIRRRWAIPSPICSPAGRLLRNPYTDVNTEPRDGAAARLGETGYAVVVGQGGSRHGYTITGWGRDRRVQHCSREKPVVADPQKTPKRLWLLKAPHSKTR